jgi:hypothetical protein
VANVAAAPIMFTKLQRVKGMSCESGAIQADYSSASCKGCPSSRRFPVGNLFRKPVGLRVYVGATNPHECTASSSLPVAIPIAIFYVLPPGHN